MGGVDEIKTGLNPTYEPFENSLETSLAIDEYPETFEDENQDENYEKPKENSENQEENGEYQDENEIEVDDMEQEKNKNFRDIDFMKNFLKLIFTEKCVFFCIRI